MDTVWVCNNKVEILHESNCVELVFYFYNTFGDVLLWYVFFYQPLIFEKNILFNANHLYNTKMGNAPPVVAPTELEEFLYLKEGLNLASFYSISQLYDTKKYKIMNYVSMAHLYAYTVLSNLDANVIEEKHLQQFLQLTDYWFDFTTSLHLSSTLSTTDTLKAYRQELHNRLTTDIFEYCTANEERKNFCVELWHVINDLPPFT